MTAREMQISFITELSHNGDFIIYRTSHHTSGTTVSADRSDMPGSDIIFYWINKAIEKFVKTRYAGINSKQESFEQTQKRIDDLRTLVTESSISTSISTIKPNSYQITIPTDYMFTVGEEVDITFIKNSIPITTRMGVKQITSDSYRREVDNPLSDHILQYNYANPLRLYQGSLVILISDGQYSIPTYYLRYIKNPQIVSLSTNCDLSNESHYEIVKMAVGLYLENTMNSRYSTYSNEINTME
jgi:hypothetical protein